ncbi:MAG: hypothetical protein ACRD47_09370 [Nitrososphaeraceae archaeon]
MNDRQYTELQNHGLRISLISGLSLILVFIIYSTLTNPQEGQLLAVTPQLKNLADVVLMWTFLSIVLSIYGVYKLFRAEMLRSDTTTNNRLFTYFVSAFYDIKYWKIMIISSIAYWIFFGFLSQILVYRPDLFFSEGGTQLPSLSVIPCCNLPGYVPMLSIYLTEHFMILIIPVNFALSVAISILVGFNLSFVSYAMSLAKRLRTDRRKLSVVTGIGATTGLFVGCPTCAGTLISLLAGFGSGLAISALAPFQTVFLLISIPALVVSPFLISKYIRNSFACSVRNNSVNTT